MLIFMRISFGVRLMQDNTKRYANDHVLNIIINNIINIIIVIVIVVVKHH